MLLCLNFIPRAAQIWHWQIKEVKNRKTHLLRNCSVFTSSCEQFGSVHIYNAHTCAVIINVVHVFEWDCYVPLFTVNCCAIRDLHAVPRLCALQKCPPLSKQGRVALQIYSMNLSYLDGWSLLLVWFEHTLPGEVTMVFIIR